MHIFLEEWEFTQLSVELDLADHVGLVPMLRRFPTLSDHTLSGKIHHILWLQLSNQLEQLLKLVVNIDLMKREISFVRFPFIGQQYFMRFGRTTDTEHFVATVKQVLNEIST